MTYPERFSPRAKCPDTELFLVRIWTLFMQCFILTYWYGFPNSGVQIRKYTFNCIVVLSISGYIFPFKPK